MPARRRILVMCMVLLVLAFGASCSRDPSPPPRFAAAFETLDRALSKEVLNRTGFASRFPKPTARQVVSFLFSPAGAQALASDVSPLGEELNPLEDIPIWPRGILLRHSDRAEASVPQVLLTWDDARGMIIAEAFEEGSTPVFRKEWKAVELKPTRPLDPQDQNVYQFF
jgi:hypothetical protein